MTETHQIYADDSGNLVITFPAGSVVETDATGVSVRLPDGGHVRHNVAPDHIETTPTSVTIIDAERNINSASLPTPKDRYD